MVIFNRLRHNTSYKEGSKEYKKILQDKSKTSEEKHRRDRVVSREQTRRKNAKERRSSAQLAAKQKKQREHGDMISRIRSGNSSSYGQYSIHNNGTVGNSAPAAPFKTKKQIPRSPVGAVNVTTVVATSNSTAGDITSSCPPPAADKMATEESANSMWRVTSSHISSRNAQGGGNQGQHNIVMPSVELSSTPIPNRTSTVKAKAKPRRRRDPNVGTSMTNVSSSGSSSNVPSPRISGWGEVPSKIPRRPKRSTATRQHGAASAASVLTKGKSNRQQTKTHIEEAHRIWDRVGRNEPKL